LYPFGGSKTLQAETPAQQVPPPPLKSMQSSLLAIQAAVDVVEVEVVEVEVVLVVVVVVVVVLSLSVHTLSTQEVPVLQKPLNSSGLQSWPSSRTAWQKKSELPGGGAQKLPSQQVPMV